ncbi:hypothetical protein H0E87_012273 [Populus deltoides]|uniref:Uncharacterized protein n=1 Tax=Populus deltoides TaxID=3696 RepID=A0A8T2YIW6_POPDE|nr:hypothetical protein H0E87_012273 [Populus deltoides]
MAKPQVIFMSPIDSPRMSHEQEGYDHLDDYEEEAYSSNGCCCFRLFTFNLRRNNEREYDILNENGDHRDPWEEDGCLIPGFSPKFAAASVDQETRRNEL